MCMDLDPLFSALRQQGHGWIAFPVAEVRGGSALNTEEQARADRFWAEADRSAFIAGRRLIRDALAIWLGVEDVPLAVDALGKPYCPLSGAPEFNVSHSGGWVALAMSLNGSVGVDIESLERKVDQTALANRFFSESERQYVLEGSPEAFFEIWTRKEAYLKATGLGIRCALKEVDTLSEVCCSGVCFTRFSPTPRIIGTVVEFANSLHSDFLF